ncbi:sister chromatid cohesion 1 protein 4 [Prunus yedoensis var. nudiflora]|uniref:Sister chromatid cohesion 1 protein 4 n=2 Tax=Prunus yedoensis var. nudiflora TaxID=2094558 RepID=A0A314XY71_PRUYE|nr:sister chromatid cohesion 1 protein 4 [Prunus yedoensis var. nudiflora]
MESTPDKEIIGGDAGDDTGIKLISGKKRSSTESTMTVQSLNSVESFGEARGKRTAESIPDDDDLLSSILVGRRSSVLKMKPTPLAPDIICAKRSRTAVRSTASKRKVLMDDTMVLHGDTIRQQLTNTEDIRRVRKKAPCTRPEISMIQRQFLEDDIFTVPVLTGMSVELIFLHTETFDLSRTRVSENDQDSASANDLEAQPAGVPIENKNQEAEDHNRRSQDTDAQEQGTTDLEEFNTCKHQPSGEIAEMEIEKEIFEVADPVLGDVNNVSTDVNVQSRLMDKKTDDEDASLQMDAFCMSPGKKLDAQPMEVDASIQKGADAIDAFEHTVEIRADVQIGFSDLTDNINATLATVSLETEECKNLSFSNDQPVEEIGNNEQHMGNETEVLDANFGCDDKDPKSSCMLGDRDNIAPLNGKESLGSPEADLQSGIEAEVTTEHPVEDFGHFEDVVLGNDTEFLNVDDDDIVEDVDDMPCAEDTRLLENSGWSSRTRAVAKYLQTLFDKEAVNGKRVLGMDSLLNGKTRKEASRMFFETLVLKTRDYIHVEQAKPFDNVNIRSRVKLMKSDF